MTVAELVVELEAAGLRCLPGPVPDLPVLGIGHDSRTIGPGEVFVALPGRHNQCAEFAGQALASGAVAVLAGQGSGVDAGNGWPVVYVDDVLTAAGVAAAAVYRQPAERMKLVGVTGTNGKTTVTYLLESIWRSAGVEAGVLGTIALRCPAFERPAPMTTLAAVDLQRTLGQMADSGCTAAALEVSSHGLTQKRVAGCSFAAAVFTNLSRDHLDYHGDEASYFAAKCSLFSAYLDPAGAAVVNADDPRASEILAAAGTAEAWTYSTTAPARVSVLEFHESLEGTRADVDIDGEVVDVRLGLLGRVNLSNALAAAAAASATGISTHDIVDGLGSCAPVPGRLERVGGTEPRVIVDYAHTPDALDKTLGSLRSATEGRIIVVFGCGGDRDRGKRSEMGAVADALSDVTVLTSDNPRSEDPDTIIGDIEAGLATKPRLSTEELSGPAGTGYMVEPDRRRAITAALAVAGPGDLVVVAGKGHEDYQELGTGYRVPFDDRAVIEELVGSAPRRERL